MNFPSWLTKHPIFLEEVQAVIEQSNTSEEPPPLLDNLTEVLVVAGILTKARLRSLPPAGIDARLHWTLQALAIFPIIVVVLHS